MKEGPVRRNRAKCAHCHTVIESVNRHDFVSCECGKIFVDGGRDYFRRGFGQPSDCIELNDDDTEIPFVSDAEIDSKSGEPRIVEPGNADGTLRNDVSQENNVNTERNTNDTVSLGSWHSYPKSLNLGHRGLACLFDNEVIVEEKIDGSQFSFGVFCTPDGHEFLRCRSKGSELNLVAPPDMFVDAVATAQRLASELKMGWTYRAEYVQKPKHNTLCYDRIPEQKLILFDVNPTHEEYMSYEEKEAEGKRLGLETVPCLFQGMVKDIAMFRELLNTVSILGGVNIEGVVIKNYDQFGSDGKVLLGKFVSEKFREAHGQDWKDRHPGQNDILICLQHKYGTIARWQKAVQHLREANLLEDSPRDIGLLLKEVNRDTLEEEKEAMMEELFKWGWKSISRGLTRGLPEWYKEELLEKQFENKERVNE